jgi:hypothetical protein
MEFRDLIVVYRPFHPSKLFEKESFNGEGCFVSHHSSTRVLSMNGRSVEEFERSRLRAEAVSLGSSGLVLKLATLFEALTTLI